MDRRLSSNGLINMVNDNGERVGGGTGVSEGIKQDVDRLMGEVFYSTGNIRDRLTSIETKISIAMWVLIATAISGIGSAIKYLFFSQ